MRIQSFIGLFVIAALAWTISENRRKVSLRGALIGILVQFAIAALLLKVPFFKNIFLVLNKVVIALEDATRAGTSFVFDYLGGRTLPYRCPWHEIHCIRYT